MLGRNRPVGRRARLRRTLLGRADAALYEAKQTGRDSIVQADGQVGPRTRRVARRRMGQRASCTYGATTGPFVQSITSLCGSLPEMMSRALESRVSVSRDSMASVQFPAPPPTRYGPTNEGQSIPSCALGAVDGSDVADAFAVFGVAEHRHLVSGGAQIQAVEGCWRGRRR